MDSLYKVEQELYKTRMMTSLSLKDIKNSEYGIPSVIVYKIERHKEYNMDSLMKYVKILGKRLFIDDKQVVDLQDIGDIMKGMREHAALSLSEAYFHSKVLPKSIFKIENGKQYRKSTLTKYALYYNITFTLTD